MELSIKRSETIRDIQHRFNNLFPYLRIDFFRFPHIDKKLSPKSEKLEKYTQVDQIVKWADDKVVELNDQMTISQFEATMAKIGMFVQVSRQSGRLWIETSYTDDWTLGRQNEEGKMMSSIHPADSDKQVDWDDWDE